MPVATWIHDVFDPLEVPKKLEVADYLHNLRTRVTSLDRLVELKACKVIQIQLWKNRRKKDSWEHEFVLATVQHTRDGKPQTRVFLVDRDSEPQSLSQKSGAIVSQSGSFGETSRALDRITLYESEKTAVNTNKSYLCYTIHFPDHPDQPHVLDLVCAASALYRLAPNYTVLENMCYWLANNICRVLAQGREYRIEKHHSGAGTWNKIPALDNFGRLMTRKPASSEPDPSQPAQASSDPSQPAQAFSDPSQDAQASSNSSQVTQATATIDPSVTVPADPNVTASNVTDPPGVDATPNLRFIHSKTVDNYWGLYRQCLDDAVADITAREALILERIQVQAEEQVRQKVEAEVRQKVEAEVRQEVEVEVRQKVEVEMEERMQQKVDEQVQQAQAEMEKNMVKVIATTVAESVAESVAAAVAEAVAEAVAAERQKSEERLKELERRLAQAEQQQGGSISQG